MSRDATELRESAQERAPAPAPALPAGHVLSSGAVLFPGAFDQHGCPLVVFPADAQARLPEELSKAEVVDFISYFLYLHRKKQGTEALVSLVADLRQAPPQTARFIGETLVQLELHMRTVHSVYIIQPQKKEVAKLLLKVLTPSKSHVVSYKKVLLKEASELCNYIDRSQLTAPLGGYLLYCHHSWVAFVKEIDAFVQDFLSVVQRLPSCISTLQALSRLPPPSTLDKLMTFCATNEAKFLQLRRELGLDELLRHCESVVEKLRRPDSDPCYQAMAGTPLFTHTSFDMLQNHSRITAAVEKVEQLWHQAFSKARLQLQVLQLREDAMQITEQIDGLFQKQLQSYKIEIAREAAEALKMQAEFEACVHGPAMVLVSHAEDVVSAASEILSLDGQARERWVLDLERLKERLHSAVHLILQTLKATSNYYHYYNKARNWYGAVLCENFLQELLSGVSRDEASRRLQKRHWKTLPVWRQKLSSFLKKHPPPHLEELVHLAHLANAIPDDEVQQAGRQMSQRCVILRKLLISSSPVAVADLQLALQWQYELLRSSHVGPPLAGSIATVADKDKDTGAVSAPDPSRCRDAQEFQAASPGTVSAEGKPTSVSSFDSGFDGVGSSPLEAWGGRDGAAGPPRLVVMTDSGVNRPVVQTLSGVSDSEELLEDFDLGSLGNSSMASLQIIPKVTADSLNLEIKVKRASAKPSNPWLSLPVDDLENSYTVTITQNATPPERDPFDATSPTARSPGSRDQPTQTESAGGESRSQAALEDLELSPISKVLSSTITDLKDQSGCATEGNPTLLWDSYDLHDLNQDSVGSEADVPLKDWEVREQEELLEVEKILDKAGEILAEEESVLAQEVLLDALLRSEVRHAQWPAWDSEDHPEAMSTHELAEAGVLVLDDSTDVDGLHSSALSGAPNLLREVRVLDELILEESLKIQELRCSRDDPPEKESPSSDRRGAFRELLEKEKQEVERLEETLDQESGVEGGSRARKVVRCSIMKVRLDSEEDQALCEELLAAHSDQLQAAPTSALGSSPEVESTGDRTASPVEGGGDLCSEEPFEVTSRDIPGSSGSLQTSPGDRDPQLQPSPEEVPLPANVDPPDNRSHNSSGGLDSNPPLVEDGPVALYLTAIEHSNTNNNNSVLPKRGGAWLEQCSISCEEKEEVPLVDEPPPEVPLEFDPGGTEEQDTVEDALVTSEVTRASPGFKPPADSRTREVTDFLTPLVLDTGSGLMKAGFSDQDLPSVLFPTVVGRPKYEEVMNGGLERETYVGHEAQHMRGVLTLTHPMRNGIICNWDDMERIWRHTFQQLRVDPEDHPVLLTEAPMNPSRNRQRAMEVMFEGFAVPFAYVAMQAALALYATGRTSGVVLDSGDGVSHSVPVFDGYCLSHAVQRFPLAGGDVTLHLRQLLQEQGVRLLTSAELEIVREMKERCCRLALRFEDELRAASEAEMVYTLPDGNTVHLGSERFRAPEILFRPELIGRDHYGMHESVFKSVLKSDIDLRRVFLENIVLSGGNTLLPGLPDRLQAELRALAAGDAARNVRVSSPKDRDFSVWSGGAALAGLHGLDAAWIGQEEYEEFGPQIVFRKCF